MEELKIIEFGIVPVYQTDMGEKVVYGTELHAVLEVKTKYADWILRRLNECDAEENRDYQTCFSNLGSEKHGGQNKKEYLIKLNTAKEMAMLEHNTKGKQVRRYFISVEEKYKEQKHMYSLKEQLEAAAFVAEELHIPQSNRIMMFRKVCENNNVNNNFFRFILKMRIEEEYFLKKF